MKKHVIIKEDLKKISGTHKNNCLETQIQTYTHTHSEADWMPVKQKVTTSDRI